VPYRDLSDENKRKRDGRRLMDDEEEGGDGGIGWEGGQYQYVGICFLID
jgi:hypothetical protein